MAFPSIARRETERPTEAQAKGPTTFPVYKVSAQSVYFVSSVNPTEPHAHWTVTLALEQRVRDLEVLVDRLIQNETGLYQGLVAMESRIEALEIALVPAAPVAN